MSTVLVVDDEPIVRDVVVRYLERDGHKTLEAGAHSVAGFAVAGGELSELASSPTPLPAGAAPFGIVVT